MLFIFYDLINLGNSAVVEYGIFFKGFIFINVMWFGQKCQSLTSQIVVTCYFTWNTLTISRIGSSFKKRNVVLERVWGLIRRRAELDEGWEVLRYWTVNLWKHQCNGEKHCSHLLFSWVAPCLIEASQLLSVCEGESSVKNLQPAISITLTDDRNYSRCIPIHIPYILNCFPIHSLQKIACPCCLDDCLTLTRYKSCLCGTFIWCPKMHVMLFQVLKSTLVSMTSFKLQTGLLRLWLCSKCLALRI